MEIAIVFGDVFNYRGAEYVYFAESAEDDLIYAGKLLDVAATTQLQAMEKGRQKANSAVAQTPIYSYVVLSSEEFKRRAVLCASNVNDVTKLSYPHASLTGEDVAKIKQEILEGQAPGLLKELIKLLT